MKGILIAIFGILIFGLSIFFYTYKDTIKENFQVSQSSGNIIESDIFLDSSAIATSYDLSGFSLIKNIVNDHINFVKNVNNYIGGNNPNLWKKEYQCPHNFGGQLTSLFVFGITENERNANNIRFNNELIKSINRYLYDFRSNGPYYNLSNYGTNMSNFTGFNLSGLIYRWIDGGAFGTCPAVSYNTLGKILSENMDSVNHIAPADLNNGASIVRSPFGFTYANLYAITTYPGITPVIPPIKVTIYNIPVFNSDTTLLGYNYSNYNGPLKFNLASSEILRLNVYGNISATQLNEFKISQLYGLTFDFIDANSIDKYLRIPYDSTQLDGTIYYFSHGKFLPDVVPCNTPGLFYLYNPDTSNITYNNKLVSFLTATNLAFPSDFTYNTVVNITPTTIRLLNTVPITHKYIDLITPTMLALLPFNCRRYITSWGYNRTSRILERRLEDLTPNSNKINFLLDQATTSGFTTFVSRYNSSRNVNVPNETINDAVGLFKQNIKMVIPNYGGNLNLQNSNFLNDIAQKYYEYSEGLSEMIYIYDIIRIGSNMLDIRFDKKQRLPSNEFINLRNQYNSQILEYNRLLDIYNQNTWEREFNSIENIQNALSTVTTKIDTVLNPLYPIGGLGTLTSLQSQLQTNAINIGILSNDIYGLGTTIQIAAGSSNISSIIQSQLGNVQSLSDKQSQYNSTLEAEFRLTNLINGIETGVARVFYTNGATPVVNGIAIGINAALSYNNVYNGNLEIDMGNSPGNVNYNPQIIYTKNISPPIVCSNVDFMNRVTQLYEDNIYNSISSFTEGIYNSNRGQVYIDKIIGFQQVDSITCGYTWQETEYDFYTNEPTVRRIMNVVLPFKFDNTIYQDPQLLIDNSLSNGIQIINRGTIPINRNNINKGTYSNLSSQLASLQTQFSNYLGSNLTQFNSIANIYLTRSDFNINYNINLLPLINGMNNNIITALDNNSATLNYFKNVDNYKSLNLILNASILNNQSLVISNKNFYDTFIENSNNLSIKIVKLQNEVNSLSNSLSNYLPLISGSNFPFTQLDIQQYITQMNSLLTYSNRLVDNSIFTGSITTVNDMLNKFEYVDINENILRESNRINSTYTNPNYYLNYAMKTDNSSYLLYYIERGTISNIKNSYFFDNIQYYRNIKNKIINIQNAQSNREVIIQRILSDDNIYLDNAGGACTNLYTCGSPEIMNQLMEQYNSDDSNTNIILRILNAYTVSPYQCDYKLELKNRLNSNTFITTRTFQIGVDYRDCTYFIGEYGSNNMGWYVSENQNPPNVQNSSNTQIQGYQYVGGVLSDYYDSVKKTVSPYIIEGSNKLASFYNSITKQRLDTYSALGSLRILSSPQCSNIDYFKLLDILSNNERFKKNLFSTYNIYNSANIKPNKILRVGIFNSNNFDVVFDVQNINNDFSLGNNITTCSRFTIITTDDFCDYTPVILSNIPPFPPKAELINLSNNLQSVNLYRELNTNYSNLNIINQSQQFILSLTKGLLYKIANLTKTIITGSWVSNPQINNILGYAITTNYIYLKIFKSDTSYFIISIPYSMNNLIFNDFNLLNIIYIVSSDNSFSIDRLPYLSRYNAYSANRNIFFIYPNVIMRDISTYNLKLSDFENINIFNTPSDCSPIYFNNNTIQSLTGLSNIVSFVADVTDPNLCEYAIHSSIERLPLSKTNFKVKFYVNNLFSNDCTNIHILYINPVDTITNSLYYIIPVNNHITNQSLLNLIRNYFNSVNSISNNNPYNSILTQFNFGILIRRGILYNVSIFYTDDTNNYLTNKLPNSIIFNNTLYIYVEFMRDPITTNITIYNFSFIDSQFIYDNTNGDYNYLLTNSNWVNTHFNIQNRINITDANVITTPSKDYFLQNFRYKYIRIDPISDFNNYISDSWDPENYAKYQLTQLQFYKDTMNQNSNISNIYEIRLNTDNTYNYINNSNINFLYNPNNIQNISNFNIYENTFKKRVEQETINIYTEQNYIVYGQLYQTSLLIEFNNPISIDGFSFISGINISKQLNKWNIYGILNQINTNNINYYNWFDPIHIIYLTNILLLNEQTTNFVYNTRFYQSPLFTFIPSRTNIILSQLTNTPEFFDMSTCITETSTLFNNYKDLIKQYAVNDLSSKLSGTELFMYIPLAALGFLNDDQTSISDANAELNLVNIKVYYIKIDYINYRINFVVRVKTYIQVPNEEDNGNMDFDGIRYFYFNYYIVLDSNNPCIFSSSINIQYDNTINDMIYLDSNGNTTGTRNYIITGRTRDNIEINSYFISNGFTSYTDEFISFTQGFTNYSPKKDTTLYELGFINKNKNTNNIIYKKQKISLSKETLQTYYKKKVNNSIQPEFNKTLHDIYNNIHYLMYDEYDLNRNLIRKNMIIGMKIKNNKVVDIIYYEDDYGNRDAFDLTKKEVKYFWNTKIGLPLVFEEF